MKTEQITQSIDLSDKGGLFDLSKSNQKFVYNGKEWKYIASGLVRDVFKSDCGKFVIKLPKRDYGFEHNILEYEVYNQAPDWCKDYIAVTELTKDNYIIQEFLKINSDCGNYYRELGTRESDNKVVVFDCDIFLTYNMKKPELGFKYQQVFCKSPIFGSAHNRAKQLPRELRLKHREAQKKHFPNLETSKFTGINGTIFIDDVLISLEIAEECGFTMNSLLDYD